MLKWDNLTFSFDQNGDHKILEKVDIRINTGKISILTGVSGCGKSTLLYLAAGIYPNNGGTVITGTVTVDNDIVTSLPPEKRAKNVGMMFQNPDLQFCMDTVKNEILFCLENVNEDPKKMDDIVQNALNFCEISELADKKINLLSGGEKQKVMLACLVALKPKWLLLDEPFANVDPQSASEIVRKLNIINKEKDTGIVVVDHHPDIWFDVADEINLIGNRGEIIFTSLIPFPTHKLHELGVATHETYYQSEIPGKKHADPVSVLRLKDVSVSYGDKEVLKQCSASFYKGRIHAVIGKSGSGKSTLFGALCKIIKYKGNILLQDKELKSISRKKLRHKLGFVFQSPQDQFVSNTVLDEISIGIKKSLNIKNSDKMAEDILRKIGLWKYRRVSPYTLSQGQQRRLAVASLLAYQCEILICDEPTYAQDKNSIITVMNSLKNEVTENNLTLIISTHDKKLARDYADIIYKLEDGKLIEVEPEPKKKFSGKRKRRRRYEGY